MNSGRIFLIFCFLFFAGRDSAAGEKIPRYAIFHYAAADNNLNAFILDDIAEMKSAKIAEAVTVIVQLDERGREANQRLQILGEGKSRLLQELPELNSGSEKTFREFLEWGFENFPAEHTIVIIGSHGKGFSAGTSNSRAGGTAFDDTSDSVLSIEAAANVLRSMKNQFSRPIDVFVSDACQMQELNVVYSLAGGREEAVTYLAGTELDQTTRGMPYRKWLENLSLDPSQNPQRIAEILVELGLAELAEGGSQPTPKDYQRLSYSYTVGTELVHVLAPNLRIYFRTLISLMENDEDDSVGIILMSAIDDAVNTLTSTDNSYRGQADLGTFLLFVSSKLEARKDDLLSLDRDLSELESRQLEILIGLTEPWRHHGTDRSLPLTALIQSALLKSVPLMNRGFNFEKEENYLAQFRGLAIWLAKGRQDYESRKAEFLQSRFSADVPEYLEFLDLYYSRSDRLIDRMLGISR